VTLAQQLPEARSHPARRAIHRLAERHLALHGVLDGYSRYADRLVETQDQVRPDARIAIMRAELRSYSEAVATDAPHLLASRRRVSLHDLDG